MQNKTLVIYYSLTGNTRKIAEKIAHALNADIAQIETVTPYAGTYDDIVNQAKRDVAKKHMPAIKSLNIDAYNHIIVGTPTWWYTMAPAVLTFLINADLTGRRVDTYITHAGWPGTGIRDMFAVIKSGGGTTGESIEIQFGEHDMITAKKSVDAWIEKLK